eukprot:16240569-Heterocapsa_arctica.AAC.1
MWTDALDHLLSRKLLWMLIQDACCGGPHDKRHQRGNNSGDRKLETKSVLDTGKYRDEDRAHRHVPGNQT